MREYTKDYYILHYGNYAREYASPQTVLKLFMETSILHSEIIGMGESNYKDINLAWMLYRWKVKFIKMPKIASEIRVKTWSSGINKFYAYREFEMRDTEGKILAYATTTWILVDILKRKPTKISKELEDLYAPSSETFFEDKKPIKITSLPKPDLSKKIKARRGDIDGNHHVNNISYINWIMECIPDEIFNNYQLRDLELIYSLEIKGGDRVLLSMKEDVLKSSLTNKYYNIVIKSENSPKNNSIATTMWEVLDSSEYNCD